MGIFDQNPQVHRKNRSAKTLYKFTGAMCHFLNHCINLQCQGGGNETHSHLAAHTHTTMRNFGFFYFEKGAKIFMLLS